MGHASPHRRSPRPVYDDVVFEAEELTLPHPAMRERDFVLAPLAEIAPDMIDPVSGLTISKLLNHLN